MPLIATRGAASAQGFGEFAQAAAPVYIEDVFSTYTYNGNGSTQTITNGIDLSTKGGMVWLKTRNVSDNHHVFDTNRGKGYYISPNLSGTGGGGGGSTTLSSFNTDGFSLGSANGFNGSGEALISWSFRKQPKFFDVVTYTGNGSARTISHNLGSTPGCIIIKCTSNADGWRVYHRSTGSGQFGALNGTSAFASSTTIWNNTSPTSTEFSLGAVDEVNRNSSTYVAYLFAHNAGGFGLTGSDNVITCGSFVGAGSTTPVTVNLGYEPQWMLAKNVSTGGSWVMVDTIRGFVASTNGNVALYADSAIADDTGNYVPGQPTATGLNALWTSGETYIYIAIRRGPMKTPTTGTSIFTPTAFSGNDTSGNRSAGLNAYDLLISKRTASSSLDWVWLDKLRGLVGNRWISSDSTSAEKASGGTLDTINTIEGQYTQNGIYITKTSNYSYLDAGGSNYVWYALKRAPGFFDEVCYTGTGSARTVSHNLGVVPELMIVKSRTTTDPWPVYHVATGNNGVSFLNSTSATSSDNEWNYTTPTSLVFSVGPGDKVNGLSQNYVAYLFASVAGVSKVGSYTGTGALQTVNCGFTSGARFVMFKRTDSTGDWYVYDSAQGISSGNDPYLLMNSTAVQATGTNYVDTTSVGFQVTAAAPAGLNANGGTYIFLAIA
jgi:hypothetical protein